jgi:hypothetical protein
MYRLKLPDGSLSDMVNLTRAKDALRRATLAGGTSACRCANKWGVGGRKRKS